MKAKLTSASNKLNSGIQGPVRLSKPSSVSKHVMKPPVNCSREPSLMLPRLPKAATGPSLQAATTTKRMSVDAGRVKLDAKAAGSVKGKGASSSISSHQVDSRKPAPQTGVNRKTTDKNVNLPSGSKIRTSSKVVEKYQNYESRLS